MFNKPILMISEHERSGGAQMLSEGVATFGLLAVIWGCGRRDPAWCPLRSQLISSRHIGSLRRRHLQTPRSQWRARFTDTFAGIRPADVPGFVTAQCAGGAAATWLFRWLVPPLSARTEDVIVPHSNASV
jgi:glycerol uptake facilitator-like aquaporin